MSEIKKLEAILPLPKLEEVMQALLDIGIDGVTLTEGRGRERGESRVGVWRGQRQQLDLSPKIKLELVLLGDEVEDVVQAIASAARTGSIGDGTIFLSPVHDAVRIRNGNQGVAAL